MSVVSIRPSHSSMSTTNMEISLWKDKYERLLHSYTITLENNQKLEDQLLAVIEKTEHEKSLLSQEIDQLVTKMSHLQQKNAELTRDNIRYKNDCILAVRLLQNQPPTYASRLHSSASSPAIQDEISESLLTNRTDEQMLLGCSGSTFPPTAVILTPSVKDKKPDPLESDVLLSGDSSQSNSLLNIILKQSNQKAEQAVLCSKCGCEIVKIDVHTQTQEINENTDCLIDLNRFL
ncbi:Tight junction-associated protein 1 [Trichinella pseudospiralis]|uniref:Tight junction-associated protein 1 n=1 Tax=Trichinella pseudospiralis TaxID=6337 RepID=A0A0V1E6G5_TRIPS|nr:Tight junction-associated protein 1 [Trichinella pseudospiralis]KRZ27712.1 Tight junction-associated protein 1 [Trichinella pseudospiralis]KRZ36659.1 Tight junction-associated protein 1 [Trichinella pseudospiralis]